jgi:hypothetical protein
MAAIFGDYAEPMRTQIKFALQLLVWLPSPDDIEICSVASDMKHTDGHLIPTVFHETHLCTLCTCYSSALVGPRADTPPGSPLCLLMHRTQRSRCLMDVVMLHTTPVYQQQTAT